MDAKKSLCVIVLLLSVFILSHPIHGAQKFGVCFGPRQLRTVSKLVQNANIGWHRFVLRWNKVMDDDGNLNFEILDRQIRFILNRRIDVLLTFRSVHELFAPGSGKIHWVYKWVWQSAPPDPYYLDYYRSFVREVVERYDGDGFSDAPFITSRKNIKYWQIEVEPGRKPDQGSNYWNGTHVDYAELYLVAHDVIKDADPEASVALSAFTWWAMQYYKQHGTSFPMEVLRILDERGGDFDIFDLHSYKGYKRFLGIGPALRAHLDAFPQFSAKPVWVTETNVQRNQIDPYSTIEEYNRFVAKDIVRRYCVFFGRGVQKVFWFNLLDRPKAVWETPMGPRDLEKFTGLTDKDFNPKPVYYTYKLLIEKIKRRKLVRRLRRLQPDAYTWIYKFGRGERTVYILWYDSPDGGWRDVVLPLPWEEALVTQVITEPGMTEPELEVRPIYNGELQIILDDSPVFVEKYPVSHCDFCDLNHDSVCNATDLAMFGDSIGWSPEVDCNAPGVTCICDLNHDGSCNDLDGVLFYQAYERADCRE